MTKKWRNSEGKLVDPPNSMVVDLWVPKHEVEAELRYLKGSISMARADERERMLKELRHMVDNPWSTPEEQRAVRAMCDRIRTHDNPNNQTREMTDNDLFKDMNARIDERNRLEKDILHWIESQKALEYPLEPGISEAVKNLRYGRKMGLALAATYIKRLFDSFKADVTTPSEVIDAHMIQPEAKPMTLGQLVDAINQLVREGKPLA